MLWSVTASIRREDLESEEARPSAFSAVAWICGMTLSRSSRKAIPSRNDAAAAKADDDSMAGMSRDQTDAAIMTPPAKPATAFPSRSPIPFGNMYTAAAPRSVPRNGTMKRIIRSIARIYHRC